MSDVKFVLRKQLATDHGITYSDMHLTRLERAGKFPRRVKLSPGRVAWIEAEIVAWKASRCAARDSREKDAA